MEMLDLFIKIVGIIGIVGAAVVAMSLIVLKIVTHVSGKWLDAKFNERLQALKHEHGKEIEQLRFKISKLLDRATKLHQREFEVLPEAWSKLNDAYRKVRDLVSYVATTPDINGMPEPAKSEFISSCRLLESEKAELREAGDKNKLYNEKIRWHDLKEAKDEAVTLNNYLMKNGIFLPRDIRERFSEIDDLVWNTFKERENNVRNGLYKTEQEDRFRSEGENLMKELGRLVHERIWPADDTALIK
jgi:hypothetical protein